MLGVDNEHLHVYGLSIACALLSVVRARNTGLGCTRRRQVRTVRHIGSTSIRQRTTGNGTQMSQTQTNAVLCTHLMGCGIISVTCQKGTRAKSRPVSRLWSYNTDQAMLITGINNVDCELPSRACKSFVSCLWKVHI